MSGIMNRTDGTSQAFQFQPYPANYNPADGLAQARAAMPNAGDKTAAATQGGVAKDALGRATKPTQPGATLATTDYSKQTLG